MNLPNWFASRALRKAVAAIGFLQTIQSKRLDILRHGLFNPLWLSLMLANILKQLGSRLQNWKNFANLIDKYETRLALTAIRSDSRRKDKWFPPSESLNTLALAPSESPQPLIIKARNQTVRAITCVHPYDE